MSNRRNPRPRYRVGMTIEFASNWQTRGGVGVVTWVTQHVGNVLTDGKPNFLYRVEVEREPGSGSAFGKSTKFVFEYQVKRQVKPAVAGKAAA